MESTFDLQQIHSFASKLQDMLQMHHSFVHSCQKVGKSGSLFGKIVDIINIASQYTIKKCEKELSKARPNAAATDEDFERDGSDLDNLEVKTGGNGPHETREEEPKRDFDFFSIGAQQQIHRKNTVDNKRQGSMNQNLQIQNRTSDPAGFRDNKLDNGVSPFGAPSQVS